MASFINDDGLAVRLGPSEAELRNVGEYRTNGPQRLLEIIVDADDLPAVADNSTVVDYNYKIPSGVQIESVDIETYVDFDSSGDGMLLSVGVVDSDGSSDPDVDFLVIAATQTELNAGGENIAGWVGAGVGAVTTKSLVLTWEVDTAAATAGQAVIRVKYSVPPPSGDTLVYSKS